MLPVRIALYVGFFLATTRLLPAQQAGDLHLYDEKIQILSAKGQRDSFLYYTSVKAEACRANDSLALWAWVRLEASDFLSDNGEEDASRQYLDDIWTSRWREPNDFETCEPFCYIQSNRGLYFSQNGNLVQAIQAYEDASKWYEQFRYPDFDALESIYKPLGNCYTRLGDNDKALAVFLKALLTSGDDEAMAGLYCNLGIAYWNKGDYEASEKYHRQGLALTGISGLKRALLLGALAQTLLDKGLPQQAAGNAAASLALLAKEKTNQQVVEYRCYSRRTAGIASTRLWRKEEATRLLSGARADALATFGKHSRDLGKIDVARANLFLQYGNSAAALQAANSALNDVLPGFKPEKPEQNPDANAFCEENVIFEALIAKAKAAQLMYVSTGDLSWIKLALDCHELAWQAETRLRETYQYSTSKLNLQGSARAREESAMRIIRMLYEKTGQPEYLEKAFAIAERSKAALLSDAMRENLIRLGLSESDPRFTELGTLRQNLSLFEKQLLLDPDNGHAAQWRREADVLVSRINMLEAHINTAYPKFARQSLATVSDVNRELQEGEALVEYFAGPQDIEAFVFRKSKETVWYTFPNNIDFQTLANRYLNYFENQNAILNDPSGYMNTAFALWQKLLPAAVIGAKKLTIVPDGLLNFIPFDALVTESPVATTSLRNAAYLLRRQEVRYAWSFSVMRQQKALHSTARRYALNLAPGFAHGERGLATLSSPDFERPSGSKNLLNEAADLPHFMAAVGGYRVLHLSTHAFASAGDGQLPRLELFDQPLFLPSIYALPLQADLVTLSACQTGLGHEQSGEGVMSLARAFAYAGTACVVSSLWSVNDQSTSRLLAGFYQKLESGYTIGQALRTAKLAYLDDPGMRAAMQSPYFWAGLTMVGDDRVVQPNASKRWIWLTLAAVLVLAALFFRKMRKR